MCVAVAYPRCLASSTNFQCSAFKSCILVKDDRRLFFLHLTNEDLNHGVNIECFIGLEKLSGKRKALWLVKTTRTHV